MKMDTNKIIEESMTSNNQQTDCINTLCIEEMLEEIENDFEYQIKKRGKEYYESNNIVSVCKSGNEFRSKVVGSNKDAYDVSFSFNDDEIDYDCTCPCAYPCKHEYAVLLAIRNNEYEQIELKETIREEGKDLKSIIENIPASELKDYMLSPAGKDSVVFEVNTFNKHFKKYLPKQSYEYYYNNLYNALALKYDYKNYVDNYLNSVKQYIDGGNFIETFKIIKAIINAFQDTNNLNFNDDIIDQLPRIGMFLRVTYRKLNDLEKDDVNKWISKLKQENYYNNYYLEDVILSLK
ncbi:MAG: SWIM zinc finger family protein [Clostridia bacterium]|nr:SWIM zinc finger family protein [Clostridia bacterium]